MKIITVALLLILVSCGKSGGGSSSGGSNDEANNGIIDFSNRPISNYELRVNGCPNAAFTAVAFEDPDTVNEVRHDWNGSTDGAGSTSINITGKAVEWTVTNNSACNLNMVMTRTLGAATAVFTATANIGQDGTASDI